MSKFKKEKKITIYALLGKIGDILLWPIIVISIFSSFFMLIQKKQNKITSVFGYSFVNILSESMLDEGFKKNDTVITKSINERDVKLGDIIAFYYTSKTISTTMVDMVEEYEYNGGKEVNFNNISYGVDISGIQKTNDKSLEYITEAQQKKAKVYFHRVIGIYVDKEGNLFFKTKGSNNYSPDTPLTRGDLIVGKYVYTPTIFRRIVSFCASSLGMIILVCIPLSILVLMQSLSLIEQISVIQTEKNLMQGKVSFFNSELQKEFRGEQMEIYNKAYYYHIAPKEYKNVVKEFLWKDLLTEFDLSPEKRKELNTLNNALALYDISIEAYFDEWIDNYDGENQRKLCELKKQIIDNVENNLLKGNFELEENKSDKNDKHKVK